MITLTKEEAQKVLDVIERNIVGVPRYKATELLRTRLAQPEREWQGLTDEERNDCLVEADPCEALLNHEAWELMRTIEAKLKEKNA